MVVESQPYVAYTLFNLSAIVAILFFGSVDDLHIFINECDRRFTNSIIYLIMMRHACSIQEIRQNLLIQKRISHIVNLPQNISVTGVSYM